MNSALKIFTGNSNPKLANEICNYLNIPLGDCEITMFSNQNIKIKIKENVRGADVFVIQTSSMPVNYHLVELLIMIDALKHASAGRITVVMPYYFYVRSDKKDEPRISITARLITDLLETAGANRFLTVDLHSPQIQGFSRIPADHLLAINLLVSYFKNKDLRNSVVVAPDAGSAKRAGAYASKLDLPLAILDKRRHGDDESPIIENIIGDVKGKKALIFDDEISTAGSMMEVCASLMKNGANEVYAAAIHPVLCGPAIERLKNSPIKEIVVTNTIPIDEDKKLDKITILSVAPLIGEAIKRIHNGESVSELF